MSVKFSLPFNLFRANKQKRAYTLLEMSIVFLVLSVLITGGISITSSMMNESKKELTLQRTKEIYEAFGRFVAKNKRLPCPASLTLAKSDIGYGQESSGDCILRGDDGIYSSSDVQNIVYGMVPVYSLGLSDEYAEDGFGSKLSYVVNSHLTTRDDPTSFQSDSQAVVVIGDGDYRQGFGLYRDGDKETLNISQGSSGKTIDNIAFAIISHGVNKNGAFSSKNAAQNSVIVKGDEYYNISKSPSEGIGGAIGRASFGKMINGKLHLVSSSSKDGNFDDLILFKSRKDLVSDFKLAHLMPCIPEGTMQREGFSIAYSGQIATGNVCESYANISPEKMCGPHGDWISKVECPSGSSVAKAVSNPDLEELSGELAVGDAYAIDGMLLPFIP